jgi:YD repeat-containing protein
MTSHVVLRAAAIVLITILTTVRTAVSPVTIPAASPAAVQQGTRTFLVRLGPAERLSIDDFPAFYKSELGLTVEMLPPLPLEPAAFNPGRRQYIAERLIESVRRAYPRVGNNDRAVVIALTEADMYIQSFDWQYAFNFRMFDQFAVVSAARMYPPPSRPDAAARFRSRARKMVSKNIAILVYGREVNNDPTSLLYANAMDSEALDVMREDFSFLRASPAPEAPRLRPTPPRDPSKPGPYPCVLAEGVERSAGGPASAQIADCIPGLHFDRDRDQLEVDLRTGKLMTRQTDLLLVGAWPLAITRAFCLWDVQRRAFGVATDHSLDIFPLGNRDPFTWMDLSLADGTPVRFDRTSPGTGFADAVYESRQTTAPFGKATIRWRDRGWDLTFPDGLVLRFPPAANARRSMDAAVIGMRDGQGRTVRIDRDSNGNLLKATTPSGQSVEFKYDAYERVAAITDDQQRSVRYTYDEEGRLASVVDQAGRTRRYIYDALRLLAATNDREQILFRVWYLGERVSQLTFGDGRSFRFKYTFDDRSRPFATQTVVAAPDQTVTEFTMEQGAVVSKRVR